MIEVDQVPIAQAFDVATTTGLDRAIGNDVLAEDAFRQ